MRNIGESTQWGIISAVGNLGGERYYWIVNGNLVSMIPACEVES